MSLRPIAWAIGFSSLFASGCVASVVTEDGTGGSGGGTTSVTSTTSTQTGGPTQCGGLQGMECGPTEYCEFGPGCGVADQLGECKPKPEPATCPVVDSLGVCGCDNITYDTECAAHAAGVSVLHTGPCDVVYCGGFGGDGDSVCGPGEFCRYPDETYCGGTDGPGICTPIPPGCGDNYAPVCGCDQMTYSNRCEASAHQVSVIHEGACTSSNQPCGGFAPSVCPDGEFCNYAPEELCGQGDTGGHCLAYPLACPEVEAPVCGCDGQVHQNDCYAHAMGVAATLCEFD